MLNQSGAVYRFLKLDKWLGQYHRGRSFVTDEAAKQPIGRRKRNAFEYNLLIKSPEDRIKSKPEMPPRGNVVSTVNSELLHPLIASGDDIPTPFNQHKLLERPWKLHGQLPDRIDKLMEVVDKVQLIKTAELKEYLPEGFAGDLDQEVALLPSLTVPLGMMFRKCIYEIIAELMYYQNETRGSEAAHCISSNGILLDGHRGTGKSFALNFVVQWARRNGWMVIFEPHTSHFARHVSDIRRSTTGLYIQSEMSQKFLERVAAMNEDYLKQIPVVQSVYGNCSLDGSHRLYAHKVMDPLIEKAINEQLKPSERMNNADLKVAQKKLQLWHDYRKEIKFPTLRSRLTPQSLWDIVNYGIQNEPFSTQCVYELFEQLKKQVTFPLLIVADEWNECFPVSKFLSIHYENTKYDGWIPAYHLTMARLFHKWDGHLYRRGMKLYATCWKHAKRRDYKPDLLGVRSDEIRTVRNFTRNEFANFVANYCRAGILHNFPAEKLEYFYMLTGGNGFESRRILTTLY